MPLPAGSKIGPYEILDAIGAGGMGEVYKAKDTRLGRMVAIKILPPHLSDKPELKQRFEREAQAIASLNHPHVCVLYDVGHHDGTDFLVMELLEGETLAEALARGPLPLADALRFSIQIADALDRAHALGVTHRDLKPGNIMLTRSGAKLLDFGLAKLRVPEPLSASLLPTAAELTQHGVLIGTVQYMAPEQIEGEEADARTDIFAFGVVLYEMVTGRKAFTGKSPASLMASILHQSPAPISTSQSPSLPLQRLVDICLAKEPQNRWQTARDVVLQLEWIAEGEPKEGQPATVSDNRKNRERIAWLAAALAAAAAVVLASVIVLKKPPEIRPVQFSIYPTGASLFGPVSAPLAGFPVISPDGRRLAFIAYEPGGTWQIWIRSLESIDAHPLAGTEGAAPPGAFWSPDSRYIGFVSGGRLQKMEVSGGPAQTICDVEQGGVEATWNRDGTILFAPAYRGAGSTFHGLFRVTDRGGKPVSVTTPDASSNESGHRSPSFLPDQRHFLYMAQAPNTIYVGVLDSNERKRLFNSDSNAVYAPPGYLLFVRQGTLLAQRFDASRLELIGDSFPVAQNVRSVIGNGRASFSVSDNGTLVYRQGSVVTQQQRIEWFDRSGNRGDSINQDGDTRNPVLSPDQRRLAVERHLGADSSDLWIIDLMTGLNSRLTVGTARMKLSPVWSPDNSRIVFRANPAAAFDLYSKAVTGISTEQLLFKSDQDKTPTDWSLDNRYILFDTIDPDTKSDIWFLSLVGEPKAQPFSKTRDNERGGTFSPDGRWVAYASDESGRFEVYVQPFPPTGERTQVSFDGGNTPRWRHEGNELLFRELRTGNIMSAEIKPGSAFAASKPKPLAQLRSLNAFYDVTADGRRFVMAVPAELSSFADSSPLTVILSWTSRLNQ